MFSLINMKKYCGVCAGMMLLVFSAGMHLSCASAEELLEPPKYSYEYRLDDIEKFSGEDPVKAIHLINVYERIYGELSPYEQEDDGNASVRLKNAYDSALGNLTLGRRGFAFPFSFRSRNE